ncbi:MAG TPA: hypothetical protein VFZ61_03625 [Polyangiales bacterium]
MTTTRLWPNLDEQGDSLEVYAEDGITLMPGTGTDVVHVQEVPGGPEVLPTYYRKKLGAQLLTYDPLGLSGDAISVAPVTRLSAGLVGLTRLDDPALGIATDGSVDVSEELEELFNESADGYGAVLEAQTPRSEVGETVYAVAEPIVVNGDGNLWIRGYGGSYPIARTGCRLVWIGGDCGLDAVGAKKSMLVLNAPGVRLSHMTFDCAPNSSLVSYINTTANGASGHCVEDCDARSGNALVNGLVDHFITSGYGVSVGNSENFQFIRSFLRNFKRAAFCFVTGQPFGWEAHRCVVDNDVHFDANDALRGAALQGNGYGMAFKYCEFRSVAALVVGHSECSIEGGSAERCKMLLHAVPAGGPTTQSFTRLRFNISEGCHLPATCLANNGDTFFDLGKYTGGALYMINKAALGMIKMELNPFDGVLSRYLDADDEDAEPDFANNANLYLALTGAGLDAAGDTFWNTQPLSMGAYQSPPPGVWMRGCKGKTSETTEAYIPNRTGCANPGGSLAFASGVSSFPVVFDARLQEHHDARYVVCPVARVTAGTPAAGALRPYVTGQTSAGFTMRLEATPGSGGDATATVAVDYTLAPR